MEVSVENTSTLGRRLKISVPDATVQEKVKAKMAKLSKEVHMKGFRKGKVPTKVLEKNFGKSVRLEVIEDVIRQSLSEAVQKNELQPAGVPQIEELKDETGGNLEFVAAFEIFPTITLNDLSGIEIEQKNVEITPNDVQKMLTKLQDQLAEWVMVDRAVQENDKITVDFARLLKEKGAKKEEQKNVQMIVGVKGVLPGLNEQLIGKNKGDDIEVDLKYPSEWPEKDSSGKEVTLWVTINNIEAKDTLTPEALAEKLGATPDNKEELLEKVREGMLKELESVLRDELKEKVLEKLLEVNPIEVPKALIDQEKEAIRKENRANLNDEEINQEAKQRVQLGLLLNEVIQKFDLKVTSQQIRNEINNIVAQFSRSAEIAEMYYRNKELLHKIERKLLLEQSVDAILKEVKIKEATSSFDEVMNPVTEDTNQ